MASNRAPMGVGELRRELSRLLELDARANGPGFAARAEGGLPKGSAERQAELLGEFEKDFALAEPAFQADEAACMRFHLGRLLGRAKTLDDRDGLSQLWCKDVSGLSFGKRVEIALARPGEPTFVDALEDEARAAVEVRRVVGTEIARVLGQRNLPDASPTAEVLSTAGAGFLAATSAVFEEAMVRLGRPADLLSLLRSLSGFPVLRPSRRYRQLGADLSHLGLGTELRDRVRVEQAHERLDPRPQIGLVGIPLQIVLQPSPMELGLVSESLAASATARALGYALISPALPTALRYPVFGTRQRSFGELFCQLLCQPIFLARARELGPEDAGTLGRRFGAIALLIARLTAASVVARAEFPNPESYAPRAQRMTDALGLRVSDAVGEWMGYLNPMAGPKFRASMAAVDLSLALRERFDEDWFRNPRCLDALMAALGVGGCASVETWVPELTGTEPSVEPFGDFSSHRAWYETQLS